ncbi:hypothetical protein JG688_00015279 [Phytophthora aleatoria]|uniref:Uncharacterized protein n=1 Tax=Phytophthora aleatoria TaxID=2496075 RepID=A0A8J5MD15_9STRA|nr:hypothetical protein JG688_00015279 [Phytophthora aleatoria]
MGESGSRLCSLKMKIGVLLECTLFEKKTGRYDNRYFLGPKASLILIKSGNKTRNYQSIDWVATEAKIRDIHYNAEINSIDKVGAMRNEETRTRTLTRLEKKKRSGDDLEELDVILKDRRLPDIRFGRKSTSTTSDNADAKIKLFWIISKNQEMLESAGLSKSIRPMLNTSDSYDDRYVWIDANAIKNYGRKSNLPHKAASKSVNWQLTLSTFLTMVNDRGLKLIPVGNIDKELVSKKYDATGDDLEARLGTKTGVDEDRDQNLSIPDSEAKVLLTEYYQQLFDKKLKTLFSLRPIVDSKNGTKTHESYYFGEPMRDRIQNIRNRDDKPVSWKPYGDLMKSIPWMDTFQSLLTGLEEKHQIASNLKPPLTDSEVEMIDKINAHFDIIRKVIFANASGIKRQSSKPYDHDDQLQKIHDDAEEAFQEYGEAQRQLEAIKTTGLSRRNNSALKAARAAVNATKAVYSINAKKYTERVHEKQEEEERERAADAFEKQRRSGLKGRGLRGRGRPLGT